MRPARRPVARRPVVWLALAVVVVVALAAGSWRASAPATPAQRAASIDAVLKCPSCEGLSVADSSAELAVAIRRQVLVAARSGLSTAAIEARYVALYGPAELLRPTDPLIWVLPMVAAGVAVACLGAFFWRRRSRRAAPAVADADRLLVERALLGLSEADR